MDENFIRKRITQLRQLKNVSEHKMSLDLGHSGSYIQSITSGRSLPSLGEFLYICEYLDITPMDFFNDGLYPLDDKHTLSALKEKAIDYIRLMSDDDVEIFLKLFERIK